MTDRNWQEVVIELLTAPTKDLRALALIAGADPSTFYIGARMNGADLTEQNLAGMILGVADEIEQFVKEPEVPAAAQSGSQPTTTITSAKIALHIDELTTHAIGKVEGVLVEEATAVALRRVNGQDVIHAIGTKARQMLGRTPGNMSVVEPFTGLRITDSEVASIFLKQIFSRFRSRQPLGRIQVMACVPSAASQLERRTLSEACKSSGAARVNLIDTALAAAVGLGLPISDPEGLMLLHVGEGSSEISVYALSGSLYQLSLGVGVVQVDQQIADYLRRYHNVIVGPTTIERVRIALADARAYPPDPKARLEISGRDLLQGVPRIIHLTRGDVSQATASVWSTIFSGVLRVMEAMPPEIAHNIRRQGVYLSGVGTRVPGLSVAIAAETGFEGNLLDDADTAAVRGAATILASPSLYRSLRE